MKDKDRYGTEIGRKDETENPPEKLIVERLREYSDAVNELSLTFLTAYIKLTESLMKNHPHGMASIKVAAFKKVSEDLESFIAYSNKEIRAKILMYNPRLATGDTMDEQEASEVLSEC